MAIVSPSWGMSSFLGLMRREAACWRKEARVVRQWSSASMCTAITLALLDVLEDEWASCRIVAAPHTALIDLPLTAKQGRLLSVASWYYNEWGFSNRLAEVAAFLAERIQAPHLCFQLLNALIF